MLVGLKIDVFDLAALRQLLPRLLDLLGAYHLKASFFPALGADPRAAAGGLKRLLRRPPTVGKAAADELREIPSRGHAVAATAYDVGAWRRQVTRRDRSWVEDQLKRGMQASEAVFGQTPRSIGAADFLINADTPEVESALGFEYAVDSRGVHPYRVRGARGVCGCAQLPVTLPRIEDAVSGGEPLEDVHQYLFMESQKPLLPGHLFNFTLHDPEHLAVLEKLMVMWMGSQRKIVPLDQVFEEARQPLPLHEIGLLEPAGGGAHYAAQGPSLQAGEHQDD